VRLHLQYYCNLSLEYDKNAKWEGLTRQDMTRARIKARRHRARTGSTNKSHHKHQQRIHKPIGPARRRERARRRAKRRGETLIEPKGAAFSHLKRLLRHAAKAIPSPQPIPTETRPQPLTSWRNPRAIHYQPTQKLYTLKISQWIRNLVVCLILLLLATAAVLPSLAMHPASNALHQVRDSTAYVNFGAAKIQQAQREQLARLKTIPHNPAALAKQFEHGVNSHLPGGVVHRVNTLSMLPRSYAPLTNCNLKIHPQKSIFATNVVEYLGHNVVGQHGITMNQAKVQAIKALPNPTNVSELRSILGFLSGYYRHFIPGYIVPDRTTEQTPAKQSTIHVGPRTAGRLSNLA
jgi:hypothetical protein